MKRLLILLLAVICMLAAFPVTSYSNSQTSPQESVAVAQDQSGATSNILIDHSKERSFQFSTILRGLLGMLVLVGLGTLLSKDRKNIPWKTVGVGLIFQIVLALGVLYVPFVRTGFEFFGKVFVKVLDFTKVGSEFLFGNLVDFSQFGMIFAFQILPTIIFFSALTSLLFYWGIIQRVVWALAWVFTKLMKLSGAEALSVAGNIFLGQTESPLMIKAYLPKMNNSEIMLVMTGGMATLAGAVLAAYIGMLGGNDPVLRLEFAKHLLTASVMAAPGAVIFSKIIVPNPDKVNKDIEVSKDRIGSNVLDAITNGTSEGLRLAVNVGAMLLAFLALIAMFNFIFGKVGDWTGLNEIIAQGTGGRFSELSLQFLLGYIFAPIMWLIGVNPQDILLVGRLLGEKLILTEFIGYISLSELKSAGAFVEQKSIIMATYILCGFANFASIGIQIGGIGALAPNKRVLLSRYGMPALIAGTLASLMSATIIGMILG
ncbi:NupC/NupG family nucleoside CNT transporter [Sunxiuqinia elliptica]|uniref:Concentrative nucleoside transporter, CNT family n=1 Tax=Sunxiuqinia elliptica TaxID=655355 RepID=A0A1I2F9T2_9BACT|nr:nucleoside transporter C-terminal domain-containing protein [Sunxiuqinia elliptica]SFF01508.1 concentrative nucleoside transporter, CNT family [Sunxiuqinia elliptica]